MAKREAGVELEVGEERRGLRQGIDLELALDGEQEADADGETGAEDGVVDRASQWTLAARAA